MIIPNIRSIFYRRLKKGAFYCSQIEKRNLDDFVEWIYKYHFLNRDEYLQIVRLSCIQISKIVIYSIEIYGKFSLLICYNHDVNI
ncbi:hypothetical protein bcgnr5380_27550 [Bacillus cereus]